MLSLLLLPFALPTQEVRFAYCGPMDSLLAPGKKVGSCTSGIPFDVVLSDGGAKISPTEFELKTPGADGTIKVTLGNAKFADGHLTASLKVVNGTGASIEGVRFDINGATETYKEKDSSLTRTESVSIASPLFFGDLGDGEDSQELSLDASAVKFNPTTEQVSVHAQLSGLRYLKTLHFGREYSTGEIDLNIKSQIFMSCNHRQVIARMEADGSGVTDFIKMEDGAKGVAVNPKTGHIAANCQNHQKLYLYTDTGADEGVIEGSEVTPGWPNFQRFDAQGRLWSNFDSAIVRIGTNHKPAEIIKTIGGIDLDSGSAFDVAPDGAVCVASRGSLFVLGADRKAFSVTKSGADGLGLLLDAESCRFDPQGNIYVGEYGNYEKVNPARISVLDKHGRLIRVFGRGAKTPKREGYPDEKWDSEVFKPYDFAFGPDGKVYISCDGDNAAIMVFQPF